MTHQNTRSAIITAFLKAAFCPALFLIFCFTPLHGQVLLPGPGLVDEGFGRTGTVRTNYQFGVNNRLKQVLFQPDGKTIAIGTRSYSQYYPPRFLLVRVDSAGRFDPSFGEGGYSSIPFADSTSAYNDNTVAHAAALQSDGKVLVAGTIGVGTLDIVVARYLVDGSLDTNFGAAGVVRTDLGRFQENSQEIASRILALPGGKILVVGQKFSMNRFGGQYTTDLVLLRYNADGTLDESFGNFGTVLIRMSLNRYSATDAKIDDNGSLFVTSFGINTTPPYPYPYSPPVTEGLLLKYDPNGVLDPTFADAGILRIHQPERTDFEVVKILPDGQLIVHEQGRLVRRNPDGTLDSVILPAEFVVDGRAFRASSHLLQEDGKIVSYGYEVIYVNGDAR